MTTLREQIDRLTPTEYAREARETALAAKTRADRLGIEVPAAVLELLNTSEEELARQRENAIKAADVVEATGAASEPPAQTAQRKHVVIDLTTEDPPVDHFIAGIAAPSSPLEIYGAIEDIKAALSSTYDRTLGLLGQPLDLSVDGVILFPAASSTRSQDLTEITMDHDEMKKWVDAVKSSPERIYAFSSFEDFSRTIPGHVITPITSIALDATKTLFDRSGESVLSHRKYFWAMVKGSNGFELLTNFDPASAAREGVSGSLPSSRPH